MQVWLKLLIVWCIAIALPVQGIAGVSRAHCGSSHEHSGAALDAAPHRHAGHEAGAAHHHGADTSAAEATGDDAAQARAQPATGADPAQTKCSSCAACCAGSALPSATPRLPEPTAAAAVFVEEVVTVASFSSDGPDRPPRTALV